MTWQQIFSKALHGFSGSVLFWLTSLWMARYCFDWLCFVISLFLPTWPVAAGQFNPCTAIKMQFKIPNEPPTNHLRCDLIDGLRSIPLLHISLCSMNAASLQDWWPTPTRTGLPKETFMSHRQKLPDPTIFKSMDFPAKRSKKIWREIQTRAHPMSLVLTLWIDLTSHEGWPPKFNKIEMILDILSQNTEWKVTGRASIKKNTAVCLIAALVYDVSRAGQWWISILHLELASRFWVLVSLQVELCFFQVWSLGKDHALFWGALRTWPGAWPCPKVWSPKHIKLILKVLSRVYECAEKSKTVIFALTGLWLVKLWRDQPLLFLNRLMLSLWFVLFCF